jgi:hypothetical protein
MKNMLNLMILIHFAIAGSITECNTCNDPIQVDIPGYDVKYTQCTFDTVFSVSNARQFNWLFLGSACDDRCNTSTVGEGYLCSVDNPGYYEVEDDVIDEPVIKFEIHHQRCNITTGEISLHLHRFLPNLWIKNTSIPYYVIGGIGAVNISGANVFNIEY